MLWRAGAPFVRGRERGDLASLVGFRSVERVLFRSEESARFRRIVAAPCGPLALGARKAPCFLGTGLLVGRVYPSALLGASVSSSPSIQPSIFKSLGGKDQPGISGAGEGCARAEPGCRPPNCVHLVPSSKVAPGRRRKEQIYSGLGFLCTSSGRQGLKTQGSSPPIVHLLDEDTSCRGLPSTEGPPVSLPGYKASVRPVRPLSSPVWTGTGWMTHPRSRS